ncbi:HAMP domain-containing protein, partial [Singulisphaera rosea]
MSSIFSKIVLWAIGMTVLSLVGVFATSRILDMYQPRRVDFISRTLALQVEGARRAFDEGGQGRLADYLRRLDELFEAEHTLIDAKGRDLVTGEDRSDLLNRATTPPQPPSPFGGRFMLASKPEAKGARLLVRVPPPRGPGTFLPYYLWILLVIGVFGYALAHHLARPLRRLRDAVDRFGHGDL